jgi:hypothetical protein
MSLRSLRVRPAYYEALRVDAGDLVFRVSPQPKSRRTILPPSMTSWLATTDPCWGRKHDCVLTGLPRRGRRECRIDGRPGVEEVLEGVWDVAGAQVRALALRRLDDFHGFPVFLARAAGRRAPNIGLRGCTCHLFIADQPEESVGVAGLRRSYLHDLWHDVGAVVAASAAATAAEKPNSATSARGRRAIAGIVSHLPANGRALFMGKGPFRSRTHPGVS